MDLPTDRPPVKREIRLPFYVHVQTPHALRHCHTVNISLSGIGLIASLLDDADCPGEGDEIELGFALPGTDAQIQVRGEVMWRQQDFTTAGGGASIAMGVAFRQMSDAARIELSRYMHGYRFHAGVVGASAGEKSVIRAALKDHGHLHFADAIPEAEALLRRGDVSVLILCGDQGLADALVERVAAGGSTDPLTDGEIDALLPGDLAPRVIYCARARPEAVVQLFNRGRIFRSLPPPVAADTIHRATIQAFGDYGVRTEYRRVALALERALLRERARAEPRPATAIARDAIVHESRAMARVLELARLVAPYKAAVLLQGETGTGKEVVARAIHAASQRASGVFLVQDCGALTETLLESELFGHVKGAFTGAIADHLGLFSIAEGGTIFLDEIANTTPKLQAKLLRVIETGEVRPVGGTQVRHVDVRVIAASNRDLGEEVRADRFRPDLYYRLNMFPIVLPPLCERPEDILPLARHFLGLTGASLGKSASGFSAAAVDALRSHSWPGNVRELRNVVERAVILSRPGRPIDTAQLPEGLAHEAAVREVGPRAATGLLRDRLGRLERDLIRAALARNAGVLRQAATELGVSVATLSRKARQHGLGR
jgi:DNA-binding NtrC family response regulator